MQRPPLSKMSVTARAKWLDDRRSELLDTQYFHVVFTLPQPIAAIALQNKDVVYNILFRAVGETLRTIAADPKHLGAQIGFFAVLHTWGQALLHHPHLHCVVPGGGISPDGTRWISCRPKFFLPIPVLRLLFRRLFLPGTTQDATLLLAPHRAHQKNKLEGLRQATFRRTGASPQVRRTVHPSSCYLERPAARAGRREGSVSLEGLS